MDMGRCLLGKTRILLPCKLLAWFTWSCMQDVLGWPGLVPNNVAAVIKLRPTVCLVLLAPQQALCAIAQRIGALSEEKSPQQPQSSKLSLEAWGFLPSWFTDPVPHDGDSSPSQRARSFQESPMPGSKYYFWIKAKSSWLVAARTAPQDARGLSRSC